MILALVTLASILAINLTKGLPSCMIETNNIVCGFKKTEGNELQVRHYAFDDTVGTILLQCGLDNLKTCCTVKDCSIININDKVNIKINVKDYIGNIGCYQLPFTTNSFDICNLTAISTSPIPTSPDTPETCVQRILDSIHHIQLLLVVVVVVVVAIIVAIVVALIKRRSSMQTTSCSTGLHKNNNSEQTSNHSVTVELGEVPQNRTQVQSEESQPFLS